MTTNELEILNTSDEESEDLDREHRSYSIMAASFESRVEEEIVLDTSQTAADLFNKDKSSKNSPPKVDRLASQDFLQTPAEPPSEKRLKSSFQPKCESFISQIDSDGLNQQPTDRPILSHKISPTRKKQEEEERRKRKEKKGEPKETREVPKRAPMQGRAQDHLNEISEKQTMNQASQSQKVPRMAIGQAIKFGTHYKKPNGFYPSRLEGTNMSSKKSIELNARWSNDSCCINRFSQNSKKQYEDDDQVGICSRPSLDRFKEICGSFPADSTSPKKITKPPLRSNQQNREENQNIMLECHQRRGQRLDQAHQDSKSILSNLKEKAKEQIEQIQLQISNTKPDEKNSRELLENVLTTVNKLLAAFNLNNPVELPIIPKTQKKLNIPTEKSELFGQPKQRLKYRDQGNYNHPYKSQQRFSPKNQSIQQEFMGKQWRHRKDISPRDEIHQNGANYKGMQRNVIPHNWIKQNKMQIMQMRSEDYSSMESSRQFTKESLSSRNYCRDDCSQQRGNSKCSQMKLIFEKAEGIVRKPCFRKKPEWNDEAHLLLEKAMRIYQALDLKVQHFQSIKLSINRQFVYFESDQQPEQKILWHFQGKIYVGQLRVTSSYQYYKHGTGIEYDPDHYVYYGQYKQDEMHGQGGITYFNSHTYNGHWRDGLMEGAGILITVKGDQYQGNFHLDKKSGFGKEDYADENIYEGEFLNGMRHGQGVFKWKNGATYRGEFKASLKHGRGCYKSEFGDYYQGTYQNDEKHGHGLYRRNDGKCMEYVFKSGKLMDDMRKPTSSTLEEEEQLPPETPFMTDPFSINSSKEEQQQRPRRHKI